MSIKYSGPVVLAILDGVGLRHELAGNAVKQAHTPFLDSLFRNYPWLPLHASGIHVGIPTGVMGNSEVGHNAIGSGQIIEQGITHINRAFKDGSIWQSSAWQKALAHLREHGSTLHFAGIFSDGGVHSDLSHLEAMLAAAAKQGITKVRLHLVIDGRDVAPQSEPKYIQRIESFISSLGGGLDYKIASGGGRMVYVADRYETDWSIVERGYNAIIHGKAEHYFTSATQAIDHFRTADPNIQDQYLPTFVIADEHHQPIGKVNSGDAFIYFDFRADRALEFAISMTYHDFPHFNRSLHGPRPENVFFAGLTEYNSDTHVPEHQLVPPIKIGHTLNTFLSERGLTQFAISETAKFGHITYYFNGNNYTPAPGEVHYKVDSDTCPFNLRPWMKTAEITDVLLDNLANYDFLRVNYAAPDMVGHFAELESALITMSTVDLHLARLAKAVDELGGIMIITADHGNIEELVDSNGQSKTSHTTNLVPCIFYDNTANRNRYKLQPAADSGISNIAPTIATLFNLTDLPVSWRDPLITLL